MRLSIIHIALRAIILAGMSACTQQEGVATEHPVAIVDSLQQIVAEEVQARVNRTEAEWGVGILMDVHSGTVVAMYDTDSTLVHAQSAWEMMVSSRPWLSWRHTPWNHRDGTLLLRCAERG